MTLIDLPARREAHHSIGQPARKEPKNLRKIAFQNYAQYANIIQLDHPKLLPIIITSLYKFGTIRQKKTKKNSNNMHLYSRTYT